MNPVVPQLDLKLTDIVEACQDFVNKHPEIMDLGAILSAGSCLMNEMFRQQTTQFPIRVLHLQGYRKPLKNRHKAFFRQPNPSSYFYHTVCEINGTFMVDVTNKLLDTEGPAMKLITPKELNTDWLMIASSYHDLESFRNIETFLKHGTKKWLLKEHPNLNEAQIGGVIAINKQLAHAEYLKTIEAIKTEHLVFTGGPGIDNINQDLFENRLKPQFPETPAVPEPVVEEVF